MSLERLTEATLTRRQVLVLGGTAVLLSGCRSAVNKDKVSGVKPKRGGTAILATETDFDPSQIFYIGGSNNLVTKLIFNTLTELDHHTLKPMPSLATSWKQSGDGKTLTMQLRDDVKFHSGRPFGPDDVLFAIKNFQDENLGTQFRSTAVVVTDMSASGAHEVTLRLDHPLSNIFDMFELMVITDKETTKGLNDGKVINGTGPFTFTSWTPGQQTVLGRNPHYWRPDRPYLDGVQVRVIPEAQGLLAALQSHQIHFTGDLPGNNVDELAKKRNSEFEVKLSDTNSGSTYIGHNVKIPPFDNKLVRQAVAHAIDRDRILRQVYFGKGAATTVPWPKGSPAWDKEQAGVNKYDPKKAKDLLQQAGVGSGTWVFGSPADPDFQSIAQIIQSNLKDIGVQSKIEFYPPGGAFFDRLRAGTLQGMWTSAHAFANLHPSTLLTNAFPYRPAKNGSNFSDPQYTDLARRCATAVSDSDLKAAYHETTAFLQDQCFITELVNAGATDVSYKLRGVKSNMFDYTSLEDAFLT